MWSISIIFVNIGKFISIYLICVNYMIDTNATKVAAFTDAYSAAANAE